MVYPNAFLLARNGSPSKDQAAKQVCPTTDSTFDLRTGAMKEWNLFVYPVKTDEENIYISMRGGLSSDASAEIVFSGKVQPGITATDVNVDKGQQGFGFIKKNEIIKGKAAVIGFLLLLDFELLTGKGLLKGTDFLDFLYAASKAFK
ncbi:photosystem II 22 kDa protein, chloroplastic-like [Quercus robur]|uniref:photosystem II 22 kDa protein, chloroplastic-like n=1 Tax=Quercus robur TaxID=38942 RepID=UPI002161EDFA|nr:photosystem II 22 kDa protein, chloroplastic-like [Quercus robur]